MTNTVAARRNTIFSLFDNTATEYSDVEQALGDNASLHVPSFDDFEGGMMSSSTNRKTKKPSTSSKSSAATSSEADKNQEVHGRRIRANVRETGFDSMKYYMKTMGNHELLQKNEEIILAREIQILIKWEEIRENLESDLLR